MRYHALGVPHTETNKKYIACAFTQKVWKFCDMMMDDGEDEVYHYGNEGSDVKCTEHISVTTKDDLKNALQWHINKFNLPNNYNPLRDGFVHNHSDPVNTAFIENTCREIRKRYKPHDFLLCFWGTGHKVIADRLSDLTDLHVVEPGIGYPRTFANYRVFESYAKLHIVRGQQDQAYKILGSRDNYYPYTVPQWMDVVIPNYWDEKSFHTNAEKKDYMFFIGRMYKTKGLEIAIKLAEHSGRPLVLAGQGDPEVGLGYTPHCDYEYIGVVNEIERNLRMAEAHVGLTPSLYVEPFCGTHAEFWFNETGILTTPWGVFAETVINGYNGYKCTSFNDGNEDDPSFVWGLENIGNIKPTNCRRYAIKNFSLKNVKVKYRNFFRRIINYNKAIKASKDPFFY